MRTLIALILSCCLIYTEAYPEQGKWTFDFPETSPLNIISKSMFAGTEVKIDIHAMCADESTEQKEYRVEWIMFNMNCYGQRMDNRANCFDNTTTKSLDPMCGCNYLDLEWKNGTGFIDCSSKTYTPYEESTDVYDHTSAICPRSTTTAATTTTAKDSSEDAESQAVPPAGDTAHQRRKRDDTDTSTAHSKDEKDKADKLPGPNKEGKKAQADLPATTPETTKICTSWKDGPYSVYIVIKEKSPDGNLAVSPAGSTAGTPDEGARKKRAAVNEAKATKEKAGKEKVDPARKPASSVSVTIETRDSAGHLLSEVDLPKLYYYLTMTIIYVLYGFMWLLMLACHWRDILRIQYFIGLVIILGFIEKVFFHSEYEHVDKNGVTSGTMVIVAVLVSVAKKTLARALVVVVAVGFGLVKPRLGPTLHKLIAVCFIYFVLASAESCLSAMQNVQDSNVKYVEDEKFSTQTDLLAAIPLALCETGILYWVFSSLLQTIRTLRLRRNIAKLSLYRHFTNLLIFSLLVSIAYFVWYVLRIRFTDCIQDNKELWLSDCFWSMLFSMMLFVIMILWRPSINNQRYSPALLINEGDEDEEDTLMGTEAFEAKKRTQVNGRSARDKKRSREEMVEDNLQWIEDNIPASVADSALNPVLNDSEEEIMTTRFELSKMD